MKLSLRRAVAWLAAGTLAAALAAPVATAHAAPAPAAPAAVPAAAYLVGWSDGVNISDPRVFTQRKYRVAANLPYIEVQGNCADGAERGDVIRLQFRYDGKYNTQDQVRVGKCSATYALYLNPYTDSGAWAVGTYRYRVTLSGYKAAIEFDITYRKK